MIACDTSSLLALLAGQTGADIDALTEALQAGEIVLPPATLSEALSNPRTRNAIAPIIEDIDLIEPSPGYWRRTAMLRGALIEKKLKARLADALIAQSCIDAGVALITRDRDFRHFARLGGLKLAVA